MKNKIKLFFIFILSFILFIPFINLNVSASNDDNRAEDGLSFTASTMIETNRALEMMPKTFEAYIKIPTIPEGLKAMRKLHSEGYNITATAIYTPLQAYLAAKAGADYAAPYVNRIDNLGTNGIEVTRKIHDIFKNNNFKTEILAASFKNSLQVLELCEYGVGAATVSPDIIEGFINNSTNILSAVNDFTTDFEKLCGKGKTMLNCE